MGHTTKLFSESHKAHWEQRQISYVQKQMVSKPLKGEEIMQNDKIKLPCFHMDSYIYS